MYHIKKNMYSHFKKPPGDLLFKAAKTATEDDFNDTIQMMKAVHPGAGVYIEAIDKTKWARPFFARRRFGHVTSNIAECMNQWLEEARHKDPVGLFTTYIRRLNPLFEERREQYARLPRNALPKKVDEMFSRSDAEGRTLLTFRHTATLYEVRRLNDPLIWRFVVLAEMKCECGFYREYGIPCRHICAAVRMKKEDPRRLIVPERRLEALRQTYAGVVVPVDLSLLHNDGIKPPTQTKKRGRPKKKRLVSAVEKGPRRPTRRPGHDGEGQH